MNRTTWLANLKVGDCAVATSLGRTPLLVRIQLNRGEGIVTDTLGHVWENGQNETGWRLDIPTDELLEEAAKNSHRIVLRKKLNEMAKTASFASLTLALIHLNMDNKIYVKN